MNQAISDLTAYEAIYRPSDRVQEQLISITLAAFIGPVAVGKTTCMDQVAQLDQEFSVVKSFATRPRRSNEPDNNYRFLDRAQDLEEIAHMAMTRTGGLVQYGVHPTTGHVYGSEVSDYDHPYAMLAALSKNVEGLSRTPFGKMVELTLVAEPYEWLNRFKSKDFSPSEASQRALEGQQSLIWSLKRGDKMIWVSTSSGTKLETAIEIRDLIKGTPQSEHIYRRNRHIGGQLLKTISQFI